MKLYRYLKKVWSDRQIITHTDMNRIEEGIEAFGNNVSKATVPDIETLKGLKYLAVGDIVQLNGYYQAGDGADHKRKIENADDGSGVQLANGLWANIVHNGEVNVSWFGAKGDGVTDNTENIQKAINFSKVVFSSYDGYFAISCVNIFKNNTILRDIKLLNNSQSESPTIKINKNTSYCTIKNVDIDGNGSNVGIFLDSILVTDLNDFHVFSNIKIFNTTTAFLGGNRHIWNTFTNIFISNCKKGLDLKNTLNVIDGVNNNIFTNVRVYGFEEFAVRLLNGWTNSFKNCNFEHTTNKGARGIILGGTNNTTFDTCYIEGIQSEYDSQNKFSNSTALYVTTGTLRNQNTVFKNCLFHLITTPVTVVDSEVVGFEFDNCLFRTTSEAETFVFKDVRTSTALGGGWSNTGFLIKRNNIIEPSWLSNNITYVEFSDVFLGERNYFPYTFGEDSPLKIVKNVDYLDGFKYKKLKIVSSAVTVFARAINMIPNDILSISNASGGLLKIFSALTSGEWIDLPDNSTTIIGVNQESKLFKISSDTQILNVENLNTPYHTTKMQQEGVYEDFITYMDEKTEYDGVQRELEQQRQLAFENRENQEQTYEEWLAEQPMQMSTDVEPVPSEKLLEFKKKYLG